MEYLPSEIPWIILIIAFIFRNRLKAIPLISKFSLFGAVLLVAIVMFCIINAGDFTEGYRSYQPMY